MFIFVPMIAGNIVQGEGNTFLPMLAALTGIILNVLLDPVLIFGMGPVDAMGLRGAAWATIAAQIVCTIFIDGAGVTRGLIQASVSGIIAAQDILDAAK